MAREVDIQKWDKLASLIPGDKVKLTDGSVAVFGRLKQKNFEGNIDGTPFNIPVNMFVEVVEKTSYADKENAAFKELTPNDWFYINKNSKAILFQFMGFEGKTIIGKNPINNGRTRIDPSLYAGKIS